MTTTQSKNITKGNLKRTTIFLPPELHEKLRCLAFEKRQSMAKLVREAIIEILEDQEDIREGMKALEEGDEGLISLEEFEKRMAEGKE